MTDEISGKPRVPVGELREQIETWRKGEGKAYTTAQALCADELEALIERHDYE